MRDAPHCELEDQDNSHGALLLSKYAVAEGLTTVGESAPIYNNVD